MALTQADLNTQQCAVPGCDHAKHDDALFLHSRCHPQSPVSVCYFKNRGVIVVRCHRCHEIVATIQVAEV